MMERATKIYGTVLLIVTALIVLFFLIFGLIFLSLPQNLTGAELADAIGTTFSLLFGIIMMIAGGCLLAFWIAFFIIFMRRKKGYSTRVADIIMLVVCIAATIAGVVLMFTEKEITAGLTVMIFSIIVCVYFALAVAADKRIAAENAAEISDNTEENK